MYPIFARYIKKEWFAAAAVLLYLTFGLFIKADEFDLAQSKVNGIMDTYNINFADLDITNAADRASARPLFDELYDGSGFEAPITTNAKGWEVPNIYELFKNKIYWHMNEASTLCIFLAGLFTATAFFSERRKNAADFVGALPYKRSSMFLAKWLAGALLISAVFFIHFILLALWAHKVTPGILQLNDRLFLPVDKLQYDIAQNSILASLGITALYSFLMFVQTLFGKANYALIITICGVIGIYAAIMGMFEFYYTYDLSFMHGSGTRILHILDTIFNDFALSVLVLGVIALVFLAGGVLCAGAAKLERTGDIFMFRPVKYLVYFCAAIAGAFAFFLFVTDVCGFSAGGLTNGCITLVAGSALTLLVLKKFFALEV